MELFWLLLLPALSLAGASDCPADKSHCVSNCPGVEVLRKAVLNPGSSDVLRRLVQEELEGRKCVEDGIEALADRSNEIDSESDTELDIRCEQFGN